MNSGPGISIVIRTSASEKPLRTLLSRLKTAPQDEIIIVDTGSTDGTIAVAESAGAIVIRNTKAFNYSHTLNLGFAAARNDWILSLSAHCLPINDDALDAYRDVIAELPDKTVVLYGLQVLSRRGYAKLSKETLVHHGPDMPAMWRGGGNTNALYSKAAWTLHPFDESIPRGEDVEWREWALKAGYSCAETARACMLYRHNKGPVYRYRKAYDDVMTCIPATRPMPWRELAIGLGSATRHLILEDFCLIAWIGEVAHTLGSFVATWRKSNQQP
jgi:glycosyltransferase involved in cell wall biosynthesis